MRNKLKIFCCTILLFLLVSFQISAQQIGPSKPALTMDQLTSWSSLEGSAISDNGKYASYIIRSGEGDFSSKHRDLYLLSLRSLDKGWKYEIKDISPYGISFSPDSKYCFFRKGKDSLGKVTLGEDGIDYTADVNRFELFTNNAGEYLLYVQDENNNRNLVLINLKSGHKQVFEHIEDYHLSPSYNLLLLSGKKSGNDTQELSLMDFRSDRQTKIWEGTSPGNFIFNTNETKLVFTGNDALESSIFYYAEGKNEAVKIISRDMPGIDPGYSISEPVQFSGDGNKLFFKEKEPDFAKASDTAAMSDVLSYQDPVLRYNIYGEYTGYGFFGGEKPVPADYLMRYDVSTEKIIRLEQANEKAKIIDTCGDIIMVSKDIGNPQLGLDRNDLLSGYPYVYNIKTGKKKVLPSSLNFSVREHSYTTSPSHDFILLHNDADYYSYQISTGILRNLTAALPIPPGYDGLDKGSKWKYRKLKLGPWIDSKRVIVMDQYDIWALDPAAKEKAVCLTNGYGRKYKVTFTVFNPYQKFGTFDIHTKNNRKLMILGFNNRTKDGGLWQINLKNYRQDPAPIYVGAYGFDNNRIDMSGSGEFIKAKNADGWLMVRESCSESPNVFYTRDFKHIDSLSHIYPEKSWNWLTAELINFKTSDGDSTQGILYKPENFDPHKKYPVIIHYYDKLTQRKNRYLVPELMEYEINIPYYVSNGYLVFTPDIYYTINKAGESVVNTVTGAVDMLKKSPWVDEKHIGIQGHSWGGFETNYIVTHTNIFAAAMSSSGPCNYATYGTWGNFNANGQPRISGDIWTNLQSFIRNSPEYEAFRVITPLLMMANKKDYNTGFDQGMKFFASLRYFGRKVWLLQYDKGDHLVTDAGEASLHTIRVKQFFDHYLKGLPAPKWMTRGVPAQLKGIDNRLEYDTQIKTPGPSRLLTPEAQKEADSLMRRKPIAITIP